MITRIPSDIKTFTHIVHVADIHIRLTKRHGEYKEVFQHFYDDIAKTPKETLIAVLGDIFHNKSDLTPECVQMASEFFKRLANLRPTVVIAGNHDATLNNKNRLDSLTPIVDANQHPNLTYIKESGLFGIGNILLNHFSVFDDYTKYIDHSDIPEKILHEYDRHIALFHGPVQDAMTDVGHKVTSKTISNQSFNGHHIVLLGDIHKHQKLQERSENYEYPVIVYPGSMIQQNHGELITGHGYVIWDLETYDYTHVELPNRHGFATIDIKNGKLTTDISNLPAQVTLRVRCFETLPSDVKLITSRIQESREVIETTYERIETPDTVKNIIDTTDIDLTNITSAAYQNELIKKYILEKYPDIKEELVTKVCDLNLELNELVVKESTGRNIRWKPIRFEFENMFSYGDGNVIDFSKMSGMVGLFAANAQGKSSILHSLCYCIFDKCDVAFKASDVLNSQKMSFNCKFIFDIDGDEYTIERRGVQDKKGNVKVDVKFSKLVDNVPVNLNGDARRNTNDIIRDYIGTYDDFLLTVLSVQNSKSGNFIDMGQADRKDLIAKFMGITIFDQLDTIAKNASKEISTLLKNHTRSDYPKLLSTTIQDLSVAEKKLSNVNMELDKLKTLLEAENLKSDNLKNKLITTNLGNVNIIDVETNLKSFISHRDSLLLKISECTRLGESLLLTKKEVSDERDGMNNSEIDIGVSMNKQSVVSLLSVNRKIEKLSYEIDTKNKKLAHLSVHKYDPNCDFCVNNVFVKDAINTRSELVSDMTSLEMLNEDVIRITAEIESTKWAVQASSRLVELCSRLDSIDKSITINENERLRLENTIQGCQNKIITTQAIIEEYAKNKINIESNRNLTSSINGIAVKIREFSGQIETVSAEATNLNTKIITLKANKSNYEDQLKSARQWEIQQEAYGYYSIAVSRDGIPYDLISNALPTIEQEINSILQPIVNFTLDLKTDGKNVICHINYDGRRWNVGTSSGLEKFVTAIAIRVALLNISNLPRPNFIAIDEGWGCMDAAHLGETRGLINALQVHFDFIFTISHISFIQELADSLVEIHKINGHSKVNYV